MPQLELKPTTKPLIVIGDLILDKYITGRATRLSPEAPVPVVLVDSIPEYRLGGAANVAANVKSLGGNPILIGRIHTCSDSKELANLLYEQGIENHLVPTRASIPVKTRIIANTQQVVRLDSEDVNPLSKTEHQGIYEYLLHVIEDASGVIISDYAKGTLTRELITTVCDMAAFYGVAVFLDPKIRAGEPTPCWYPTVVTPNSHEAEEIAKMRITDADSLYRAGAAIQNHYNAQQVLITQGDKGMSLWSNGTLVFFRTTARDVFDVSGAGDTVIAAMALAMVSGYAPTQAVDIANHAAGVVVGKRGTSVCTIEELNNALKRE